MLVRLVFQILGMILQQTVFCKQPMCTKKVLQIIYNVYKNLLFVKTNLYTKSEHKKNVLPVLQNLLCVFFHNIQIKT